MAGPPRRPRGVERPSGNAGKGHEALLWGWEGSVGHSGEREEEEVTPERLEGVGRPSRRVGMGQEAHLAGWVWSKVPSREPVGIGRARKSCEALAEGQEGLGSPPRRPGRSLEALPEDQKGSVSPSDRPGGAGGPGEVGRHSRKGQEWSGVST